ERVVPERARKPADALPRFRVGEVRRELIGEARALLKPECFVPQISVEQSHHRLTDVSEAKDENVFRLFTGSPKHSDEHVVIALRCRLNHRCAAFANLFPKTIKRTAVT